MNHEVRTYCLVIQYFHPSVTRQHAWFDRKNGLSYYLRMTQLFFFSVISTTWLFDFVCVLFSQYLSLSRRVTDSHCSFVWNNNVINEMHCTHTESEATSLVRCSMLRIPIKLHSSNEFLHMENVATQHPCRSKFDKFSIGFNWLGKHCFSAHFYQFP